MADPQKNKQTVLAYYNLAFNDRRPAEAVEKYGGHITFSTTPRPLTGSKRSLSS